MSDWNLPPGVTTRMIDEAAGVNCPCEVCGMLEDQCICPVCKVCGAQGDPHCYWDIPGVYVLNKDHGIKNALHCTRDQIIGRAWQDALQEDYDRTETARYQALEERDREEGIQ